MEATLNHENVLKATEQLVIQLAEATESLPKIPKKEREWPMSDTTKEILKKRWSVRNDKELYKEILKKSRVFKHYEGIYKEFLKKS